MESIFKKDYSLIDEFERDDYHYHKFKESEHYILWRVDKDVKTWNRSWDKYELWKKVPVKNPDGTVVFRKLNDGDGGKYLWFFNTWQDFQWSVKNNKKFQSEELAELAKE